MNKPLFDKTRSVSWSQINSFEYDPEQWYQSYMLGKKSQSREMDFGNLIDKKLQEDPAFLPHVPRYPFMQFKMKAKFGKISLVGVPDGLDLEIPTLADYKTGRVAWDQKRANETGQLTMYLLLVWLLRGVRPEEFRCRIHWLPTRESGDFSIELINDKDLKTFETKRTMKQLLDFGVRINKTVKAMELYAKNHD